MKNAAKDKWWIIGAKLLPPMIHRLPLAPFPQGMELVVQVRTA